MAQAIEGIGRGNYRKRPRVKGADRFFLHDPDGNLIELIEWRGTWPEVDPDARPLPPLD